VTAKTARTDERAAEFFGGCMSSVLLPVATCVLNGDEQASELQRLLDRVNRGDDAARMPLIDRAYERLHHLSALILRKNFPRLMRAPAMVDSSDVADELSFRLYHALAEARPVTVRDFFRLAAQRIRWLLIELARQADRGGRPGPDDRRPIESYEDARRADPPAPLADLYLAIEHLPAPEREVVYLLYFHELSQADTATRMGVTERTVRRYSAVARLHLLEALKEVPPPAGRR
jgi:RNA polymerase sigma factor (sigma-70 family)